MPENRKIARRLVEDELEEFAQCRAAPGVVIILPESDPQTWPAPPSAVGPQICFMLGQRDELTEAAAKRIGDLWRKATQHYPRGVFIFFMFGYNADPREMWEIPDTARYVRWWARYAGMDDLERLWMTT
jgi:hypothetical protein